MLSWRRIGLVVPSSNTVMENDLHRLAPGGVTVHTSRMYMVSVTVKAELEAIENHLEGAVKDITTVRPDVIVFGCTSASALMGKGFDLELSSRITDLSGVNAVTVSTAVVAAIPKLGLKRITVVTPYIKEINDRLKLFLEGNGVKVDCIDGLGIVDNLKIAEVQAEEIYDFAMGAFKEESDGLFLSCTNFHALDAVESLEKNLKRPVFSSNSAAAWYVFKKIGVREPVRGFGRLLLELS